MGLLTDIFNSADGRMAMGLLAAGGPQTDINKTGFGARLQDAVGSVDHWKAQKQQADYMAAHLAEKQALADQRQAAIKTEMEKRAFEERKRKFTGSLYSNPSQGSPELGQSDLPPMLQVPGMQSQAAMPASRGGFDLMSAIKSGMYSPDELAKMQGVSELGMPTVARTIKGMKDGKEVEYQLDKFGNPVGSPLTQWKAPILNDGGGQTNVLDPYNPTQVMGAIPKTQTLESKASNALGWANHNTTAQRLNWDMNGGGEGGASQSGLNKQFGKPQAGYRWKEDGSLEFIPGGPADQKAQAQKGGEGTVGGVVAGLRDAYGQLEKGGGIVNDDKGAISNLMARGGSTGIGQAVGGALGTKNQTLRQDINMTRPLLLQAIMKATGMSAKQMDSNAELKLYLSTATDPTMGIQANMKALDRIESMYGGGPKPESAAKTSPSISPPKGAIDMLKMSPKMAAAFDAKYGDGAAASILGK